jgi:hypothetical protein
MSEDESPHPAGPSEPAGKATSLPAEAIRLQRLYEELTEASAAAGETLRYAIAAPTWVALQRFRDRSARVDKIIERIKQVLA